MKWLHFSDLHFRQSNYHISNLRSKLVSYVKKEFDDIDFIVITGDVMDKCQEDSSLPQFICDLVSAAGCEKKALYICPGNHDLDRGAQGRADLVKEARSSTDDMNDRDLPRLSGCGFASFDKLYHLVTGRDSYHDFELFECEAKDGAYRIVSLNTCLLAGDSQDEGNLRIMSTRLNELGMRIGDDDALNIVIMHHGVSQLRLEERLKFEHWVDDSNVDIVLCGHVHKAGVRTYDDTERFVKQLTSGTAQYVDYDAPAFFCHEFDRRQGVVSSVLYTYAKGIGGWGRDARCLRAFDNGVYISKLKRFERRSLAPKPETRPVTAGVLGEFSEAFMRDVEARYKENFGEEIVTAARGGQGKKFSAEAILRSLITAGVPFGMALMVINRSVDALVNDKASLPSVVSTEKLGEYIYDAIRKTPVTPSISSYDLRVWSGKYARRYRREGRRSVLTGRGRDVPLTFKYIKSTVLPEAFASILGSHEEYDALPDSEKESMAEESFSLLSGMDVDVISLRVLTEIVAETALRTPHPWVVNDETRRKVLPYHKKKLNVHLDNARKGGPEAITFSEVMYHGAALLLLQISDVTGCRERSPLLILQGVLKSGRKSAKSFSKKKLEALKQFAENNSFDWKDFVYEVNALININLDDGTRLEKSEREAIIKFGEKTAKLKL